MAFDLEKQKMKQYILDLGHTRKPTWGDLVQEDMPISKEIPDRHPAVKGPRTGLDWGLQAFPVETDPQELLNELVALKAVRF
jgi:hypothetical protein